MNSWKKLSDNPNSFFYNILFLEGYENSSNIYALEGDYLTLIDTGNDYTAFLELFEIYKPENIKKIFLTHGHSDHTLGLLELIRAYSNFDNFEVILHKAYAEGLEDLIKKKRKCKVTAVLGGEKVNLSGFEFEVIHTPGHTIDSICLYHRDSKTLFSGDSVSFHPSADVMMGGDMRSLVHSLRVLKSYEIKNILPGHTLPAFLIGQDILNKAYRVAIRSFAPESESLKDLAFELIKAGLLDEAVIVLDDCIKEVDEEERYNMLGLKASLLADMGRHQESIKLFDEISAKNPNAIYSKGMVYMRMEKYKEALELSLIHI